MEIVTVIVPCYNENVAVIKFLQELDIVLQNQPFLYKIIIVDDASTDNTLTLLENYTFSSPMLVQC